jgi:hypothetical protein
MKEWPGGGGESAPHRQQRSVNLVSTTQQWATSMESGERQSLNGRFDSRQFPERLGHHFVGWRQGTEVKVVDAASGIARTRTAGCHPPPAGNEVRGGKAAKTLKEPYLCAISTLLRFRLWQRTGVNK